MPRARSHKGRTHAENQSQVCLICFQRGSDMRKLVNVNLLRVRKYFFEDFDPSEVKLPNGICSRCRKLLENVEKGSKDTSDLLAPIDFNTLKFPALTRSLGSTSLESLVGCQCSICKVANAFVR